MKSMLHTNMLLAREAPLTVLNDEYTISRNIVPESDRLQLCQEAEQVIKTHYSDENVRNHIAYLADIQGDIKAGEGRAAYAFVIHHSLGESNKDLPGILFEKLPPKIKQYSQRLEGMLGIKKGRYLLNFQLYYDRSVFLPLHFDGELYKFIKHRNGEITITEAIVPHKTAVATLINYVEGGAGTRISTKDKSHSVVAECKAGDLLIFNNSNVLHGADSFNVSSVFKPPYARFTMGWRSLEYDCKYLLNGGMTDISYEEAVQKNLRFMKEDWPREYAERKEAAY